MAKVGNPFDSSFVAVYSLYISNAFRFFGGNVVVKVFAFPPQKMDIYNCTKTNQSPLTHHKNTVPKYNTMLNLSPRCVTITPLL